MKLSDGQTEHALTVLTRLAQREPRHIGALAAAVRRGLPGSLPPAMRVAMATGQPMADVLTALARELDADQLALVRGLLPADSAALRFLADTVLDRLLALHAPAEPDDVAERIALLANRAESLIEIGAPRQALPIAREAVDLAAPDGPVSYEVAAVAPNALRVLSRCYAANGEHAAAVDTAEQYLRAVRFVCLQSPCADVAGAHHTLANRLRQAGRDDEALEQFALARELYERLLDDPLWYVRNVKARVAASEAEALIVASAAALGKLDELGVQPDEVVAYVPPSVDRDALRAYLVGTRLAMADLADDLDPAAITELTQLTELTQELVDADRDRYLPMHVQALTVLARRSRRLEQAETFLARARAAAESSGTISSLSGGAFVEVYVEALLNQAAAVATARGTTTLGELLTALRKVVGLYRSVRVPEALLSGSRDLTFVTEQLLEWARFAEQAADDEEASRLIDDAHEGATLLHEVTQDACHALVECSIVRSRIADRAGRTHSALQDLLTARKHLPHLAGTTRQLVVGAVINNNIARRYSALGDTESAAATAGDGLRTIIDSGLHTSEEAWWLAVSMSHTGVKHSDIKPGSFVDRHTDDILALLAAAPTPPAETETAVPVHVPGFAVLLHHIALPRPRVRDAVLRALRHAMARPGLPAELRHACARRGYETLCLCVDARQLDAAAAVYAFLVDLAGDRTDPGTFVEQAKAATELIQAYLHASRRQDAVAIARQALPVMRTPEYLATRERDLGQPAHEFLATLDSLLADGR